MSRFRAEVDRWFACCSATVVRAEILDAVLVETSLGRASLDLVETALDDMMLCVLVRIPLADHDSTRAVCRSWNRALRSRAFENERREAGYREEIMIVSGGYGGQNCVHAENAAFRAAGGGGCVAAVALPTLPSAFSPGYDFPFEGVHYACAASHRGDFYLLGGEAQGMPFDGARGPAMSTVWHFNLESNRWSEEAPLPEPRQHAVCGIFPDLGRLVVAGGKVLVDFEPCEFCFCEPTATAYAKRLDGGGWEQISDPPFPISGAVGGVIDGRLFVVGGVGGTGPPDEDGEYDAVTTIAVYDPRAEAWEVRTPQGHRCTEDRDCAAAVLGDGLYVVGRSAGETTPIDIYDHRANCWWPGPAVPSPTCYPFALGVLNGCLVAVGAINRKCTSGSFILHEDGSWRPGPKPPAAHGTMPLAATATVWT